MVTASPSGIIEVEPLHQGVARLITMMARDASLQLVAQAISDMFGLPASIIDANFAHLALSDDYPALWKLMDDDQSLGFVPLRVQQQLKRSEIFHPKTIRADPVYFDITLPDGSLVRNYTTLIYLRHVPIASFSLFTWGEAIEPDRLRYLPLIASLLSLQMQKSSFYLLNKSTMYSNLLATLLDKNIPVKEDEFRLRLGVFGPKLARLNQAVLIDVRLEDTSAVAIQSFAERFSAQVPNSVFFIHAGDIVYLTSNAEHTPIKRGLARGWATDLARSNMRIGLSGVFSRAGEFRRALNEAKAAIDTGLALGATGPIFFFDDYRLIDLVRRLPKDVDPSSYIYPPLLGLLDYDRTPGSHLALTRAHYLAAPTHPQAVCDKLFIHKNTLYYRLNKIRELMDADLDSTNIRSQSHLGFLILKTQNQLDFDYPLPSDTSSTRKETSIEINKRRSSSHSRQESG
jgi:hypothetical protein